MRGVARSAVCLTAGVVLVLVGWVVVPSGSSDGPLPSTSAGSRCAARGVLPDTTCTPGATNPDVTPSNITTTICHPGWSRKVRPSTSITGKIKRKMLKLYGYDDVDPRTTELDHLIPISWGGALADERNLWIELDAAPNLKDKLERKGLAMICSGQLELRTAQTLIAADWQELAKRLAAYPF